MYCPVVTEIVFVFTELLVDPDGIDKVAALPPFNSTVTFKLLPVGADVTLAM